MQELPSGSEGTVLGTSTRTFRRRVLEGVSRPLVAKSWYAFVILFFSLLVLAPTLFVLTYVGTNWSDVGTVVSDREKSGLILHALYLSFGVAGLVAVVDLAFGLPLAWFLVRRSFRGKSLLNTLIDSPLIVTTAGLGFSVALFWGITPQLPVKPFGALGLTSSAFWALMLLHFTTTFPYSVRSLAAILEEIDIEYETAARTCGASRLTAARTVTLPLFRSGLATSAILCLAKALSDTGGALTVLVTIGSLERNGSGLIADWKAGSLTDPTLLPALSLVSALMVALSLVLLAVVKVLALRAKVPIKRVWPAFEKRLSKGKAPLLRDVTAFSFLILFILVPSFFFLSYVATSSPSAETDWNTFFNSIIFSFLVGGAATLVDLALGIPMALMITRGKMRGINRLVDSLVNVPYIIPSGALGISLSLFWTTTLRAPISELVIIVMAHVAFTYPFVVRNVVGAMEQLDPVLEETARTLGAKPLQVFRRITFPTVKASILAGAIMAFTRSVGETGATLAVSPKSITVPVFIVNLIRAGDYYQAALAQVVLLLISFIALLGMRFLLRRAE